MEIRETLSSVQLVSGLTLLSYQIEDQHCDDALEKGSPEVMANTRVVYLSSVTVICIKLLWR
jgi:hypothetical protein